MKKKHLQEAENSNCYLGEDRNSWLKALGISLLLHLFIFLLFLPVSIPSTPFRKPFVIYVTDIERTPADSGSSPEQMRSGKNRLPEPRTMTTSPKKQEQGGRNSSPKADASLSKTIPQPASTGPDPPAKRIPADSAPGVEVIAAAQSRLGEASTKGNSSAYSSGRGLLGGGEGDAKERLKGKYLAANFSYITNIIQKNLTYPPKARLKGWKGSVLVSFVILENGRVEDLKILRSSGYELLDGNVLQTIKTIGSFPKPPVKAELQVPVVYRLAF